MTSEKSSFSVGDGLAVVGGGAMGAGIAALACERWIPTTLCEVDEAAAAVATERVDAIMRRRFQKGAISGADFEDARSLLRPSAELEAAAGAAIVIEAAPENLDLKRDLFARLAAIAPDAVLASNTSAIPIAELAGGAEFAARTLGIHFFNPPGAIRFVELVRAQDTGAEALERARGLVAALGDEVVTVPDGPGFLVNRCARPYYLEALRIAERGLASPARVDRACEELGGFRMGPFRLMDLIGIDVGLAVARTLWSAAGEEPRWRPSPIQAEMVAAGRLGRKSGAGFYSEQGEPLPLPAAAAASQGGAEPEAILMRIVAQLVNEAWFAIDAGVAAAADIDRAMVGALRYPRGPAAWGEEIGLARVVAVLDELAGPRDDPTYRVAAGLRAAGS